MLAVLNVRFDYHPVPIAEEPLPYKSDKKILVNMRKMLCNEQNIRVENSQEQTSALVKSTEGKRQELG